MIAQKEKHASLPSQNPFLTETGDMFDDAFGV
jgi:hypothetical protein